MWIRELTAECIRDAKGTRRRKETQATVKKGDNGCPLFKGVASHGRGQGLVHSIPFLPSPKSIQKKEEVALGQCEI